MRRKAFFKPQDRRLDYDANTDVAVGKVDLMVACKAKNEEDLASRLIEDTAEEK